MSLFGIVTISHNGLVVQFANVPAGVQSRMADEAAIPALRHIVLRRGFPFIPDGESDFVTILPEPQSGRILMQDLAEFGLCESVSRAA